MDHTARDDKGYMLLVDVGFSAYFANVLKTQHNYTKPNIRLQVWSNSQSSTSFAEQKTSNIPQYDIDLVEIVFHLMEQPTRLYCR